MATKAVLVKRAPLMDPLGETEAAPIKLNDGLGSLEGKRIGLLDNSKPNADETVNAFRELMGKYKVKEWIYRKKPLAGNVAPADMLDELAEKCDGVITAHCD